MTIISVGILALAFLALNYFLFLAFDLNYFFLTFAFDHFLFLAFVINYFIGFFFVVG